MTFGRFSFDKHLRSRLAENYEYGFPDATPVLDWLQSIFAEIEFTRFITATFKWPQTDELKLQKLNRSIANRLKRAFHRNNPTLLKLLFINEMYPEQVYPVPDYHLHLLMSEPIDSGRECDFYWCSTKEYFNRVIENCLKRSIFTNGALNYFPIADVDIQHVGNQADRLAYVAKTVATPYRQLLVDLRNSTFPQRTEAEGRIGSA